MYTSRETYSLSVGQVFQKSQLFGSKRDFLRKFLMLPCIMQKKKYTVSKSNCGKFCIGS